MQSVTTTCVLLTLLLCAGANAADCSITSTGNAPLYPSIFVPRTAEEEAAGLAAANNIPAGPTVLLNIGMSNAKGLWDTFRKDADADPLKSPEVQVVNGAQPGGATASWAQKGLDKTWGELDESLENAGVTREDVSAIWFVNHNAVGSKSVEDYSAGLESDAREVLDLFAIEFPNLKIVWIEPMIYAGYSTASGNKEPHALESGVVAQRLLVDQNWPFFVGYGAYMWADGMVSRGDGLTWECSDFKDDGHHPDTGAKTKNSAYLLQFFHEDSIASIVYLEDGTLLTVPDVTGLAQSTAESSIVSAGFAIGGVSSAYSDTVLAGNVISQSPAGGSKAAAGTAVGLVVSLGPVPQVTVPDVIGLDQATAESAIVSANLAVGAVSTVNSDTVPAGNVVSQNPGGGAMVDSGSTVDLEVSLGPVQQVTVPDVVGLDQASAESSIVSALLVVGAISTTNSDTVLAGSIISQNPTGGSVVNSGTEVDLEVSLGPATGVPKIISPEDGSTLSGSSETFTWSAEGTTVSNWRLEIGTTPGGRDIYRGGFTSTVTSQLVSGLPTDGSTVYVRLRWRTGGVTSEASYVYTASGDGGPPPTGTPAITAPTPGSVLSGASETFTWSAESTTVTRWRLEVGTTVDGTDLLVQSFDGAVTSTVVNGLPTDGSLIYVNLRWRTGTSSGQASYVYTAAGGIP